MATQTSHGWAVRRAPKKYEARWYDAEGKRRSKCYFATIKEAKSYAREQSEHAQKIRSGEIAPDRPQTVDALLDMFVERHGRTLDPSTLRTLKHRLQHARTEFGHRHPDSLRKAEIEDWRLTISPGVVHYVFRAFRQALTWASDPDRGLMERNPSNGIKNPKPKRHQRRDVFPFESWTEIEAVAEELDYRFSAIPIVMAGTGLRPEEALALHRSDVEFDHENRRGRLHVQRRISRGLVKDGTKTGDTRMVPFGERVYEALRTLPPRIDTAVLFPAPKGGYIDLDQWRTRQWNPALRAAGIEHRRIYDLRHTYASWMLAEAVPPAKLAKMMGTSIAQLDDTYHRFLREDEFRYGTALDNYGAAAL